MTTAAIEKSVMAKVIPILPLKSAYKIFQTDGLIDYFSIPTVIVVKKKISVLVFCPF